MKTQAFPNAYEGVKKIWISEILNLVGAAAMLVAAISILLSASASYDDAVFGLGIVMIIMLGSSIALIVAFIFKIIGINRASLDEPAFKTAFFLVIAGLVVSVVSTVFGKIATVKGITSIASDVIDLAVTVFIIRGIRNLAVKLSDHEIDQKGDTLLKLFIVIYALLLIAHIVALISVEVSAIVSLIAAVLSLVQAILYLLFLNKAKTMLE